MELAVAPPSRIAAGVALDPPLVITFVASAEGQRESNGTGNGRFNDIIGVWAFLTLVSADRSECLAPPRQDLLQGSLADSIHPIHQPQKGSDRVIGYAKFPDLAISEPGRYCFRVNLVDMNR